MSLGQKILRLFLAACMTVLLVPAIAFAQPGGDANSVVQDQEATTQQGDDPLGTEVPVTDDNPVVGGEATDGALGTSTTPETPLATMATDGLAAQATPTPGGTVTGGDTITTDGEYTIVAGATGTIVVESNLTVTLVGAGTAEANKFSDLSIEAKSGVTLTIRGVYIDTTGVAINFTGATGTLIQDDTNYLRASGDGGCLVRVPGAADVDFKATDDGVLYAYKSSVNAGFGSLYTDATSGKMNFKSGTYYIEGSKSGAVIGGGFSGASTCTQTIGDITVSGAVMYVVANASGAAFGSGGSRSNEGPAAGNVYMTDGQVYVWTDWFGAAPGQGGNGAASKTSGHFYVSGGSWKTVVGNNAVADWGLEKVPPLDASVDLVYQPSNVTVTSPMTDAAGAPAALYAFDASDFAGSEFTVKVDGTDFYTGTGYTHRFWNTQNWTGDGKDFADWIDSSSEHWASLQEDFDNDQSIYLYLTKADHTLTVGSHTYKIKWDAAKGEFVGMNLLDEDVANIAVQKWTGGAVTPEVTVTHDGVSLTKTTDYTVEYANHTDLGIATATVTGTGAYAGTVVKEFEIANFVNGGDTISADGSYHLASGATGDIVINANLNVRIVGNGVYAADGTTLNTPDAVSFKVADGTTVTYQDLYMKNPASHMFDLQGVASGAPVGNTLIASGLNMFETTSYGSPCIIHVPGGQTTSGTCNTASVELRGEADSATYFYKYSQACGIGGAANEKNGTITFMNGTWFMKGSKTGATIGHDLCNDDLGGDIVFNGGALYIETNSRGAAIGGSAQSRGCNVYMNGGQVYLWADYVASIGAGGNKTQGGLNAKDAAIDGNFIYNGGSVKIAVSDNAATSFGLPIQDPSGTVPGGSGSHYYQINDIAIKGPIVASDKTTGLASCAINLKGLFDEEGAVDVKVDGTSLYTGSGYDYRYWADTSATIANWIDASSTDWASLQSDFDNDQSIYLYLTKANHVVTVGDTTINAVWDSVAQKFYTDQATGMSVAAISDQLWTGSAIEPELDVANAAGSALVKGTDYTVTYEDNIDIGTATAVVTGMGFYSGTISKNFEITKTWNGSVDTAWYNTTDMSFDIGNPAQLAGFAAIVNGTATDNTGAAIAQDDFTGKTVTLTSDIALNASSDSYTSDVGTFGSSDYPMTVTYYTVNDGVRLWTPIGFGIATGNSSFTTKNYFNGHFDGDGHNVTGLYTDIDSTVQGLFGCLGTNGTVQDVTTDGCVAAKIIAGGVVAYNDGGTITGCTNEAVIYADGGEKAGSGSENGISRGGAVGGIVGALNGAIDNPGSVDNCVNNGTITCANTAKGGRAGGIIGLVDSSSAIGSVTRCINNGDIYTYAYAGGIVGYQGGNIFTISECGNTGAVSGGGTQKVGCGGITASSNGDVTACYNTGTIKAFGTISGKNQWYGGIVGVTNGTPLISNCYTTAPFAWSGTPISAGGNICQYGERTQNCYYLDTAAYTGAADTAYTTSKTAAEMKAAEFPASLGFIFVTDSSTMSINGGYPVFYWQSGQDALDIREATVTPDPIADQPVTGEEVTPDITVKWQGTELVEGTDYELAYSNNTRAGQATISISGLGRFINTKQVNFNIVASGIALCDVEAIADEPYTGVAITPQLVITDPAQDNKRLVEGADYGVVWFDNVEVGEARCVIMGNGDYSGSVDKTFTITKSSIADDCIIEQIPNQLKTGAPLKPAVVVRNSAGVELVQGVDYGVVYFNNINLGTAKVNIAGNGNYEGTNDATFEITDSDISSAMLAPIGNRCYSGNEIEPDVTVTAADGTILVRNTDYTVKYANNIEVGTAKVTVYGAGSYAGAIEGSFQILAAWDGSVDISWFNPDETVYYISTPSQLAGVAALANGILCNGVTISSDMFLGDASYIVKKQTGRADDGTGYRGYTDFAGKTIVLSCDLDMGGVYDATAGTWSGPQYTPVGGQWMYSTDLMGTENSSTETLNATFNGTFDGAGHTVKNVYHKGSSSMSSESIGLIGRLGTHDSDPSSERVDQPVVKNLSITGYISAGRSVGGIVGKCGQSNLGCQIVNCANFAEIHGAQKKGTGGIAGAAWNKKTSGAIINCYNAGDVYGGYTDETGGIAGANEIALVNCYNVGTVHLDGGASLAADAGGSYTNSYWLTGTASTGVYGYTGANVTEMSSADMQASTFVDALGSAFAADTEGINNGYPVLYWQAGLAGYDITGATISAIPDQGYTGNTITPDGFVTLDGKTLVAGTDYTVACANNTNVSTDESKAKVVSITGLGRYIGTLEVNQEFNIIQGNLADCVITDIPDQWTSGEAIAPTLTVKNSANRTLKLGTDYTVAYTNNTAAGTATATITGIEGGNYTGTQAIQFTIYAMSSELSGEGTATQPYLIGSAADLQFVAAKVNTGETAYITAAYKVISDFTATGVNVIGTKSANAFAGTIDGDGHTITLDLAGTGYNALIGYGKGCTFKKLTLAGSVAGYNYSAAFLGQTNGGDFVFENCTNNADISNVYGNTGGFIGYASNASSFSFKDCVNNGAVTGGSNYIGGFIGQLTKPATFINCVNTGAITAAGSNTGGFVGSISGTCMIDCCYNTGAVTATYSVGGIAGSTASKELAVYNVYNTGSITATVSSTSASVGCGGLFGTVSNSTGSFLLGGTYNIGTLDAAGDTYAGSLVGSIYSSKSSKLLSSYYLEGSAEQAIGYVGSSVALTNGSQVEDAATLKGMATNLGASFTADTTPNVNSGYPILYWQTGLANLDLSAAAVDPISDWVFTGTAIEPGVTVKLGGVELVEGSDFVASFSNNINVGQAKLDTITGVGRYSGSKASFTDVGFDIVQNTLGACTIAAVPNMWFCGKAEPALTVTSPTGKALVAGTDYVVTYTGNTQTGVAKATINPVEGGNYSGMNAITFNITAASTELQGSGTDADPYQIGSAADLEFLAYKVNTEKSADYASASYKVTQSFSAEAAGTAPAVEAIGNSTTKFSGDFDGGGHVITLGIDKTAAYQGLFGYIDGATIKNITVDGFVNGSGNIGGIAGYAMGSPVFDNCTNKAAITSMTSGFIGGILGGTASSASTSTTFESCTNKGAITCGSTYVGGIVGRTRMSVQMHDCANTAAINLPTETATTSAGNGGGLIGGIAATHAVSINSSYNTGAINGSNLLGGLIGTSTSTALAMVDVYNTGDVFAGATLAVKSSTGIGSGGIVGRATKVELANAYNTGSITVNGVVPTGALVGSLNVANTASAISNSYYTADTASSSVGYVIDGATVADSSSLADQGTLKGLASTLGGNFTAGTPYINDGYPILIWQTTVTKVNFSSAVITAIDDQAYTGKGITPTPAVTLNRVAMKLGADYDLVYANNVELGTAATVTAVGRGKYEGSASKTFTIVAQDIANCAVDAIAEQPYTGKAVEPAVVVKNGSVTLVEGTDYKVVYSNNTAVGTAKATVVGHGNYAGTQTADFNVVPCDISTCTVDAIAVQAYTGSAVTPAVRVMNGDVELVAGTDYSVAYFDNVEQGTATASVIGMGSYNKSQDAYFSIGQSITYQAHVQDQGWLAAVQDGVQAGTTGSGLRMEALRVDLSALPEQYAGSGLDMGAHIQNYGDTPAAGDMIGKVGESKRVEAIWMSLTGTLAADYDVYYRVHVQDIGWMGWACDGAHAGTAGLSKRIESVQIQLVKKGDDAPSNDDANEAHAYIDANLTGGVADYAAVAHIQNKGNVDFTTNGANYIGTMGEALRIEALTITEFTAPDGADLGIKYRTHIQNIGWQGWKAQGELSGTQGESKRLEALSIELTGADADAYDVYYRTHVQNIGWTGWAKNGQDCGSAGFGYRMEAMQIMVVPKDGTAPGINAGYFYQQ